MCKYRCVFLAVIVFALRVNGGSIETGSEARRPLFPEADGQSNPKGVSEVSEAQPSLQKPNTDRAQKTEADDSRPVISAIPGGPAIGRIEPEAAHKKNGNAVPNTRTSNLAKKLVPNMHENVKPSQAKASTVPTSSPARKDRFDQKASLPDGRTKKKELDLKASLPGRFGKKKEQLNTTSPVITNSPVGIAHQGPGPLYPPAKAAAQSEQTNAKIKQVIDKAPEIPNVRPSPGQSNLEVVTSGTEDRVSSAGTDAHKPTTGAETKVSDGSVSQSSFSTGQEVTVRVSSSTTANFASTTRAAAVTTKAVVQQHYDADDDEKAEEERVLAMETSPSGGSRKTKSGQVTKKQEDRKNFFLWDNTDESYRRTVPTQWSPQYGSSESRLGVQKPPETAPVGPYPTTGEEDSHFFAYFLAATVVCVVAYLAFHNKRKIMALAIEGRGGRQRRHTVAYRRLDTAEKEDHKGRAIF